MPLTTVFQNDVAVLGNVARSMNDPRYPDAGREVAELLEKGYRNFVIELSSVRDTGSTLLGILMTITREIRKHKGEVVLGDVSKSVGAFLEEMKMDDYWDVFSTVAQAINFYRPRGGASPEEVDYNKTSNLS